MDNQDFYKGEFFKQLNERLDKIDKTLDFNTQEIAKITAKFNYVFGLVAGITIAVNVVWTFFKEKIVKI